MLLQEKITHTQVRSGELAIFYLAQAGFLIKTARNKRVVIDAYLSDAAERLVGFKRMSPPVLDAEALDADLYLSTHEHVDHLDPDTVRAAARNGKTRFIGAPDCEAHYRELGIDQSRCVILKEGCQWSEEDITVKAIYADHGELAPYAVGFLLDISGIKSYRRHLLLS